MKGAASMSEPVVSVIMSVFHGANDVAVAVRSILGQSFRNLELIVIDNGSFRDDTRSVIQRLSSQDSSGRMRVVTLDTNIGLAGALNVGIRQARGRYIARQDHDDISDATRIEKQVAFMESHASCGLLGTAAEIWSGDRPTGRFHDHPCANADIQMDLLVNNPFVHSSVLLRREVFDACGGYSEDPERQPPEDFELWSRVARRFTVANLSERLVIYREVAGSMSRDRNDAFAGRIGLIAAENIAWWSGLGEANHVCRAAAFLMNGDYDRVPRSVTVDEIIRVLEQAVDSIQRRNQAHDLGQRKAGLVATARHHFGRVLKRRSWPKRLKRRWSEFVNRWKMARAS